MGLGGSSEGKIKWQIIPVATSGTASAQVTTPWRNQWFSFDFNILGGYQYYLNETHGIRGALSLGTGIRNNLNTDAFCINNPASATGASCGYFGEKLTTFNLGLTADYLFDFYNHGDTSIGASLGLGYGFNGGFLTGATGSQEALKATGLYGKLIAYHTIPLRAGLHYYLGNHQLEFLLALSPVIAQGSFNYAAAGSGTLKQIYDDHFFYSFNLNYTYRFSSLF